MGVTLLRASHSSLAGTGVIVAQPEAMVAQAAFEVNPAAVGEPESLFDWISTNGASAVFPNIEGYESGHADFVADCFYASGGVATNVAHVDNYEADYFVQYVVQTNAPIDDEVVNQSFAFFAGPPEQQEIDSIYDDYTSMFGTIFASAPNNYNNSVGPPGTAYNCIGVGAYGAGAVITDGPTQDNGRSKPDIVAPGVETSFTTPYVAGAAAVLLQAATEGYAGDDASAAADVRTIKAILLNSALKPFDWTHTTTAPLDTRYGAGVLNLYYAYQQFSAGEFSDTTESTVLSGAAHPPVASGTPTASTQGWNFKTVNIGLLRDTVDHYVFNITSNSTATATLDWERQNGETNINNLELFLYNATNGALIASSVSMVDNVQHIYVPHLPPGKYDLEVVALYANSVSSTETYALAFQFFGMSPPKISVTETGGNTVLTWPWSPTVYTLQEASRLGKPSPWTNVTAQQWITNTTVWASVTNTGNTAYFRLVR